MQGTDEETAAVVAEITEDAEALEASAVTLATSIVEDLTDAAIEQPEVYHYSAWVHIIDSYPQFHLFALGWL